jgi:hypothetical protein
VSLCSRDLIIGTLASSFQGVLSTILRPIVLALLIRTIQRQRLDQATTAEAVLTVLFFAAISFADNMTKVFAFQKVNVAASARYTSAPTLADLPQAADGPPQPRRQRRRRRRFRRLGRGG